MKPTLCTRCKKNVAVIFITKIENGASTNEGLCLKCAKDLGIKQVDDIVRQMGMSDEDLENMTNEMTSMMGLQPGEEDDDEDVASQTATFPFLNKLFGNADAAQAFLTDNPFQIHGEHGAAFIYDGIQMDPPCFQRFHDRFCAAGFAHGDFFVLAEKQINVPFRCKAFRKQRFNRFHHSNQMVFHINSAAAPNEFAVIEPAEGCVCPVVFCAFRDWNHILMRKQRDRVQVASFTLPAINEICFLDDFLFQPFANKRERIIKERMKSVKLGKIHFFFFGIADGGDGNCFA